ncbi:hypothetical protein [Streptomyces luteocolor]|uniref:hypothetical protein n=2 Tax=Streptomyces TaxID=1883 RepID=UPI000853E717|nr:hypothetical protein [Streptomyces luteocolor]
MRTVHKTGLAAAAALAGLTAAVVPGSSASAAPSAAAPSVKTAARAGGVAAAAGCPVTRFGHAGRYKCHTRVMDAYWDSRPGYDETFVIAPDRTIWHIWGRSGGWKRMPNGGKADNMAGYDTANGRTVAVWVGSTKWCTNYKNNKWNAWHKCRG